MPDRIQKILSAYGYASRRQAETWITAGRVQVNGQTASLGDTADPTSDTILVDGVPLAPPPDHVYILLNKPRGYVTTARDEKGRRTVTDLVSSPVRVYPVGRLDMASEGLLLLTNDGELANRLLHPSHEVDKTYLAWVSGYRPGAEQGLREPMPLDGSPIRPAKVETLSAEGDRALLRITIHEGRNRQIRRMCEQCGMEVRRLRRVSEGPLSLDGLKPGSWRYLSDEEISRLKRL